MAALLGLTILSFFINIILFVPFIDFLYRAKVRRQHQETRDMFNKRTPIFDKFHKVKVGTPIGGGILVILLTCILTVWSYGMLNVPTKPWEMFVIFFAIISFGALGFIDDWKKLADPNQQNVFFGLRFRHKFVIQWILAFIIATVFYYQLGYSFVFIHGFGLISIGALFIPFAAFVIVSFVNAVNITDGLDGLASGLLVICLVGFLAINSQQIDKSLGVFISVLLGSVLAFLYFNIYKARIWMGDVGALALGAALAVIGLLTGKTITVAVIGGVFIIDIASSLIQILSKKYLKRKLFTAAPFHLYLQQRGWEEPKIVMRAWLVGILFAVLGVYLAFLS